MAVWNEINLQNVEGAIRLDAEYYQPQYFEILKSIKKLGSQPLSLFASPSKKMFSQKGLSEFRYVEISRVSTKDGSIEAITIPIEETPSRAQYIINTNDIIISTVRPERNAVGLITEELNDSICSSGFQVLTPNENLASEYLFAYLKSKPIVELLSRRVTASMYPAVTENDILSLPFFIPSASIYNDIVSFVKEAIELRRFSKTLYQEAEALLLHELGLDALDLSNQIAYESSFDVFARNSRLDSEFYQPKYQILADALSSIGSENVGSWGKALKGKSVSEYIEEGIPVVRSGDLTDINNVDNFKYASSEEDLFYLKRGDVLISSIGFGSIGKVQVFEGEDNSFATVSEVTVIRQNRVNPYYLQLFLQSVGGQLQIEKWITGATGQLHLYPRDVEKFLIPIIDKEKQEKFEKLIKNSVSTKEQAKQLLENAKQRVEDMILGE